MASKIKKQIQDEIFKNYKYFTPTQQALLQGIYDKIDTLDNDTDVVNTVWANRDLPLRMITQTDLSEMLPGLSNLMIGEPRTGEVNLEKSFGKDWKDRFNDIPYNHIALVAEKNGVDPKVLLNTMRDEKIKSDRKEIAESGPTGLLLSVFGRRQQEAIERGEDPSMKDYAGDIGESALYAIPYGRAATPIKNLVARRLAAGTASVVAPPVASEVMDNVMYDENNPRGEFSKEDIGSGIATNLIVPRVLRGAGRMAKQFGLDRGLSTIGQGQTAKEMMQEASKGLRIPTNLSTQAEREAAAAFNKQPISIRNVMLDEGKGLNKVMNAKGSTVEEKAVNFMKANKKDPSTHFVTETGKIYEKWDPNQGAASAGLTEVYDKVLTGVENAKTVRQLAEEEAFLNLASNKFGDQYAEGNNVLAKVPIIGNVLQKKINTDDALEKELQKRREIEEKYKFMFGGLR